MSEEKIEGIPATNEIAQFAHCRQCLSEVLDPLHRESVGHSPATWSQLEIGWTKMGLQVWCRRHDCNVMHIDFEGQKHPANLCVDNGGSDED